MNIGHTYNKILVICDRDSEYGMRLADYFRKSECGYEVLVYTEAEAFINDMACRTVSLLLIEEAFMNEMSDHVIKGGMEVNIEAVRRYILVDDRDSVSEESTIYKYQSAAAIVGLIGQDIEAKHRIVNDALKQNSMKLIGVYSPVNHTLKTTFALTLGQIMAEGGEILYINLEGYNGLYGLLDIRSEYNMQELLYEYSINPSGLKNMLQRYTVKADGLNVLIPVRAPYELQETDPLLWISFLSALTSMGKYDAVILDLSDCIRGIPELLNICSCVYMPVRNDGFSLAKLKDFDEVMLRYPDREAISNKLIRLKFPYFEDIDGTLGKLKTSRLGKYIRSEICCR